MGSFDSALGESLEKVAAFMALGWGLGSLLAAGLFAGGWALCWRLGSWLAAGLLAGGWALGWRLGKRSRLTSTDEAICAISVLDPYTPSVHRDAYHGVGPADARAYNCPIGLTVLSPCM